MSEKIYCGNGKGRNFDGGGSVVNVTLDVDVLAMAFKEHGWTTDAGKRKIKVKVCTNRDGTDNYGNTHYAEVDTWKPDPNRQHSDRSQPYQAPQQSPPPASFEDDIPF